MILYSEKAASELTDITLCRTSISVISVVALSYLLYPALSAIGTTAVAAKTTITTFSWAAGMNYLGGIGLSTGIAYGVGFGIDQAKEGVYSTIPTGDGNTVKDYVDGFETNPEKLVQNHYLLHSDGNKGVEEHANDLGGATAVAKETIGDRSSEYITRDRTTSVRLDDIEEHGVTTTRETGSVLGTIDGRNPDTTHGLNVVDENYRGEETGNGWCSPKKVKYLTNAERAKLKLEFKDGKVFDSEGNLYDTSDAGTFFSGKGKSIFVMDSQGNIYASKYQAVGDFHHSIILGGDPVSGAGEIAVKDGIITEISNRSGHYQPDQITNSQVIDQVESQGIKIDDFNITGY